MQFVKIVFLVYLAIVFITIIVYLIVRAYGPEKLVEKFLGKDWEDKL